MNVTEKAFGQNKTVNGAATYDERITNITNSLQQKLHGFAPKISMILGSGLGSLADQLEKAITVPYNEIEGLPQSTIEGHKGQFVFGWLNEIPVMVMQGRFHYYEGYDLREVTIPVRVMSKLGINKIIVTNSAGGVNENFAAGDLMLIEDHINLSSGNPLMGPNNPEFGPRFPDMTYPYDQEWLNKAKLIAENIDVKVHEGVYLFNTGPSYETRAEVRMARTMGADVVGMSTVPEVIVARHCGMKVLGISLVSNMAAGVTKATLDHSEVIETASKVEKSFVSFVGKLLPELI